MMIGTHVFATAVDPHLNFLQAWGSVSGEGGHDQVVLPCVSGLLEPVELLAAGGAGRGAQGAGSWYAT